jgi:hypothetical protein
MMTLFFATAMIQQSCEVHTNTGLAALAPLLMAENNNQDDTLMSLLLIQMMSGKRKIFKLGNFI